MLPVLAIQHDIRWEDKAATHARVEAMLSDAAPAPGTLVVLPELFDTGFSLRLVAVTDGRTLPWASSIARRHRVWLLVGHGERATDGLGRNCATLIAPDGVSLGCYEKVHPFGIGGERRAYGAGSRLALLRVGGLLLCPLICYDLRFPELWRLAAMAGAEAFLIGASWPNRRQHHWRALCIARAIENQAYVVAVNRVGTDPSLAYAGGSLIVSPRGEVLSEGGDEEQILTATLDPEVVRTWRTEFPALRDAVPAHLGRIDIRQIDAAAVEPDCHASRTSTAVGSAD